jgi:tetratricopeptide (TPR) repeat protein
LHSSPVFGGLCLLLLGAACATPETDRLLASPGSRVERVELSDVPFHPQDRDQCGPASLAMVLEWGGLPADPETLRSEIFTPGREGSLQSDIVAAARRHGRVAYPVSALDEVLTELSAGHPVLVLQNLGLSWYARWHYAVAIGYDLPARSIVLHTGRSARRTLGLELFERTWARGDRWAIVVLPPSELPGSAVETRYLRAVVGLEQAMKVREAELAYGAALDRWPSSLGAWIGLGNSRYAQGDLVGAEVAFREATLRHPSSAAAFHNLAEVLAELGRASEAEAAARRAAALRPLRR